MEDSSSSCPPELNNDVAGVGVRVSFYLQALFMALLSVGSPSLDEIIASLYTLVITNLAMAVTALILGYKAVREITFLDGLVVLYLVTLSWLALQMSFPSYYHRMHLQNLKANYKGLELLALLQTYVIFAFALALFIDLESFGSTPECNSETIIPVLLIPIHSIVVGRTIWLIAVTVTVFIYTLMTVNDYFPIQKLDRWLSKLQIHKRKERGEYRPTVIEESPDGKYIIENGSDDEVTVEHSLMEAERLEIADTGRDLMQIGFILFLWGLTVASTEVLIKWNQFRASTREATTWQFGQILQLFLTLVPLISVIKVAKEHKLVAKLCRKFGRRESFGDILFRPTQTTRTQEVLFSS